MEILQHGCCRSDQNQGIAQLPGLFDCCVGLRFKQFPDREGWDGPWRTVRIQQVPAVDAEIGNLALFPEQRHGQAIRDRRTQLFTHGLTDLSRSAPDHSVTVRFAVQ